ncbi:MAG: DeoR/GlpR family DNA-binding transcription regulator [Cytophagales bacterium]|nr:DeoR/GlpR family DNA-binding transcription regulator [Cytophagales bacterium]
MLKKERQVIILKEISENQRVISSELSKQLGVSEDTIRRDLKELSDLGKINKVHGGAVLKGTSYLPFSLEDREEYAKKEKTAIAHKAIELIEEEQVVFMDGGTTNLIIARLLPHDLKATFVTNCLPVAYELSNFKNIRTIFLGGRIIGSAKVTVGLETSQLIKDIHADLFFLGTRSIHSVQGVSDINLEETNIKKLMVQKAERVVSVAISEKLGSIQPFRICKLDNVHTLITELDPEDATLEAYRKAGLQVL